MPSRSSSSRSGSRTRGKSSSSLVTRPPASFTSTSTQAPTLNIKHETPSLFSSIKSGFGFAIGNRIASNIMGPSGKVFPEGEPSNHNDTRFDNSTPILNNNCEDIKKIYDNAIVSASLTEDIRKAYDKCIN